ncbi:hypothetical protein GO730_37170 [Spirosoma sp. HMF3257]|uniref:Lipocalin-like domain-containing protein n=1 Tax=Spirosoma telluris TaxID=2183553 RepID=A0A327NWN4_9BACT|nr:hypothetical protein [Spirosoma telluris]RAI78284.1 hypothetical protein HMF3257_37100 [Spirosoma telluris]
MKRTPFLFLSAVLLGLLFTTTAFTVNSDSLTPGNHNPTKPSFVGARWQMSSFKLSPAIDYDGDGKPDADLLPFMAACDRDNSIVFAPSGKLILSDEAVRCDHKLDGKGKPGFWSYDPATQTIQLINNDKAGSKSSWEVVEASSNVLTIKTTVTESGKTSNIIMSWKAI